MLNLHTHEEANDYLQHLKESYINSHAAFIIFEKFLMRNLNFCIWPSIIKLLDKAVIFSISASCPPHVTRWVARSVTRSVEFGQRPVWHCFSSIPCVIEKPSLRLKMFRYLFNLFL